MKIREGFVSNSSSASFICPVFPFGSVFNLAREMLLIRNLDWNSFEPGDYTGELIKLDQAVELGINNDTPVQFSTTNYDTYIRIVDGYLHVDTCNNINWEPLYEFTADIQNYGEEGAPSDIKEYYFWYIKEGVVGKPVTDEEWRTHCKENNITGQRRPVCTKKNLHFNGIVKTPEGKIQCVYCYKEDNGRDVLIYPATRLKYRPIYIPKKIVKLR